MRSALLLGSLVALSSLVGCAANGMDEEDAAADAAPSGKSDGIGFATGPYQTLEIDYLADEPLLAWFHDNGDVDFTRFISEDQETESFQGTYKLYRYGGKDRIRLADADGNVLLRSDRTTNAAGKLEFGGETWYQARKSPDDLVDCLAIHVVTYESLEESLTEWEYPDAQVTKVGTSYELRLGASSFDAAESTIEVTNGPSELVATSTTPEGYQFGLRVPAAAPRRGEIFFRDAGATETTTVANIVCR
jgi:hypothetical protein